MTIGEADFLTAAARTEPDQGASFYGFGPRVLMHYDDIPPPAWCSPAVGWNTGSCMRGRQRPWIDFSAWLEPQLQDGQSLVDVDEGQPGIGSALERAESFLLLAGSLAVVLAGVAVALAARRFSERHHDYVAIMKSLGATSAAINRLYGSSLLLLGGVATVLGCLLGWGIQALFFRCLPSSCRCSPAPAASGLTLIGGVTSLTCLLCFAWPPLRRLGQASPLRVLRRDLPLENRRTLADYVSAWSPSPC